MHVEHQAQREPDIVTSPASPSAPLSTCAGAVHGTLIVGVYVDDFIIIDKKQEGIDAIKRYMTAMFRMSHLGMLSYYLGVR